jgi:hypothetical protein
MDSMKSYDDLAVMLNRDDGVKIMVMRDLRDIHGAERLGIHVRDNISKELARRGLAHFPQALPDSQTANVGIFKQGTPIAAVIGAVLHPEPDKEQVLRSAASGRAERILEKIRELVENQ